MGRGVLASRDGGRGAIFDDSPLVLRGFGCPE